MTKNSSYCYDSDNSNILINVAAFRYYWTFHEVKWLLGNRRAKDLF